MNGSWLWNNVRFVPVSWRCLQMLSWIPWVFEHDWVDWLFRYGRQSQPGWPRQRDVSWMDTHQGLAILVNLVTKRLTSKVHIRAVKCALLSTLCIFQCNILPCMCYIIFKSNLFSFTRLSSDNIKKHRNETMYIYDIMLWCNGSHFRYSRNVMKS
jgi:hypothetical protein